MSGAGLTASKFNAAKEFGGEAGAVKRWEPALAQGSASTLSGAGALDTPALAIDKAQNASLKVKAPGSVHASVRRTSARNGGFARTDKRTSKLSDRASAHENRLSIFSVTSLKIRHELTKGWDCPGTGPHGAQGVAHASISAEVVRSTSAGGRADRNYRLNIRLRIDATASDDAGLKTSTYSWRLSGRGFGSYGEAEDTTPKSGVHDRIDHRTQPRAQSEVVDEVRRWARLKAQAWVAKAHQTWDGKHRCLNLKGVKPRLELHIGIPRMIKLWPVPTGGDKKPVKQTIRIQSDGPITVSPQSAIATAAEPAVFTLTNNQPSAVNAIKPNDSTATTDHLHIVGLSDDGRSVLDETVDTAPPTVTVYSYTESQNATGSDAAFSGQGSLTVGMASPAPYSDQNDELNCQSADETPLYDAAATDLLADSTGAAYACSGALWIGDQTWNISGSGTYTDPDDPTSHCSDSYSGQFPLTGTATPETVYLLYDADGNLTSAFLDALPGGFAGDIDYNPAPEGSFSSAGSGLPDALRSQETCYGTSAHPFPETDYRFALPDVSAGKQLSVSLSKAGTADASGTPDGGAATVNYNFSLKTVFKIDNAGDPPGS